MTENKRKFKFNILDVLIIAVVLAVGISVALRYDLTEKIGLQAKTLTFEVKFIVQNIQEKSEQYFVPGEQWYMESTSKEFGTLKELLDVDIAKEYISIVDGTIVRTDLPDGRIDVTGVFTCTGTKNSQGYMIEGTTAIAAGKNIVIKNNNMNNMQISVLSVSEVTAGS